MKHAHKRQNPREGLDKNTAKRDHCCPTLLPEAEGLWAMASWKVGRSFSRSETFRLGHEPAWIHGEELTG